MCKIKDKIIIAQDFYNFEEYDLEQSQQGHVDEPENWKTSPFVKNFWDFIMRN